MWVGRNSEYGFLRFRGTAIFCQTRNKTKVISSQNWRTPYQYPNCSPDIDLVNKLTEGAYERQCMIFTSFIIALRVGSSLRYKIQTATAVHSASLTRRQIKWPKRTGNDSYPGSQHLQFSLICITPFDHLVFRHSDNFTCNFLRHAGKLRNISVRRAGGLATKLRVITDNDCLVLCSRRS